MHRSAPPNLTFCDCLVKTRLFCMQRADRAINCAEPDCSTAVIIPQLLWLSSELHYRLAKEAALHDPFAGLTNLKPSTTPKYSPPLKNMSPGSSAGQASNAPSPGMPHHSQFAQPSYGQPQQPQAQPAANGFQGQDASSLGCPMSVCLVQR